jgi:hypothetical protein
MAEISNAQIATNATTPTLIVEADVDGCAVMVHNRTGIVIYLGDASVTSATGLGIDSAAGLIDIKLPPQAKLYAIAASSTPSIQILKVGNN